MSRCVCDKHLLQFLHVSASACLGSDELLDLIRLRRTYLSADHMVSELVSENAQGQEDEGGYRSTGQRLSSVEKRRMFQVSLGGSSYCVKQYLHPEICVNPHACLNPSVPALFSDLDGGRPVIP